MAQDAAQVTRRRRHILRIALVTIVVLLVAIVGGGIIVVTNISPDRLKPRIAAAVKRATGRELLLNGPIRLSFSPWPSVQVSDVSFANPPGFSRPMMATLQQMELQLSLLPLLLDRIEIVHLVLVQPDLLLETDAQGRSNWTFPVKPSTIAADEAAPARIGLQDVRIDGGTIAYHDKQAGRRVELGVTELLMQAPSPDAPLHLLMQATANGAPFSLVGEVGGLSRLQDPDTGEPWPVKLRLTAGAATVTIDGSIGHLASGRLYGLQLAGTAPDIAPLAAFLPGIWLPPLHDASVSARLVDAGTHFELDATLRVAGTSVTAKGAIADVAHLAGVDIALTADAPDTAVFSALAGRPLPPLRPIGFQARLADAAGDLNHGLALRDIKFTSEQADVAGDVVAVFSPRPSLKAKLTVARIDTDALLAADSGAPPPLTQPETAGSAIPDSPLPFGLLRAADADIELAVDSLQSHGIVYHALAARMALKNGQLSLAPFTADQPEGRIISTLSVDVTQPIPQIALTFHAPGLEVQPLLAVLGLPNEASGKLRVSLELHGTGSTPHAIAAGLDGHLGLAMVRGTVSNWLLANTVGWALRKANLPGLAMQIGTSRLRCFALRLDFNDGVGELNTLLLDSLPLYLDGGGTLRLGDEKIDIHLRPEPRVAEVGLFAPLHVSGTLSHPSVGLDPVATVEANAGMLVGIVEWLATPFVWVAETLGLIEPRVRARNDCIDPLIQARATEAPLRPIPPLSPLELAR